MRKVGLTNSGSDSPSITRRTATSKQSVKQKALEVLKRRRSKSHIDSSANGAAEKAHSSSSESEGEDEQDLSDFEEETVAPDENFDGYDSEFVVEDDEATLGAPVELPFEFSKFKTMKAKELFK